MENEKDIADCREQVLDQAFAAYIDGSIDQQGLNNPTG